uniref:Uncharacterized protein n=1 Tax=Peronospora matthiolae TaxID=2874970 RepID=A0AAV1V3N7_9STRA
MRRVHQKRDAGAERAETTTKSRSVLDMAIRFPRFAIKQRQPRSVDLEPPVISTGQAP